MGYIFRSILGDIHEVLAIRNAYSQIVKPPDNFELIWKYTGKKSGYEVTTYKNPNDKLYYQFFNGHLPSCSGSSYSTALSNHYLTAYDLIFRFESEGEPPIPAVGTVLAHDKFEDLNLEVITFVRGEHLSIFATTIKKIIPGKIAFGSSIFISETNYSIMFEEAMVWHKLCIDKLKTFPL
jgi:hypothetical protein